MKRFNWRGVAVLVLIPVVAAIFTVREVKAAGTSATLEDELIQIKLGTLSKDLEKKYPGLYTHRMDNGQIRYESCNQNKLQVFNFIQEPWAYGYITAIKVWQEKDESVCRGPRGALPDLSLPALTPRSVKLGDTKDTVLEKYGEPTSTRTLDNGDTVMTFRNQGPGEGMIVLNLTLSFHLQDGRVTAFSLEGDIPGVEKPALK